MSRRGMARLVVTFALAVAGLGHRTASAVEAVRLLDWSEPARLVSLSGAGHESFELSALARWRRQMAGRLTVKLDLPGGRVQTQSLDIGAGAGPREITVYIPAASVRNLRPNQVVVGVSLLDPASGEPLSNILRATITNFPSPQPGGESVDLGPFGWGTPLSGAPGEARLLPRPGPDDLQFARIPAGDGMPGYYLATTEATNGQVGRRLGGYNPRAGRSDEFELEDSRQPALGLSPAGAREYLAALGKADRSGVVYRLPTRAEWLRAARAGRPSPFWWGDATTYPEGANLLGPEPSLKEDTTAPSAPGSAAPGYRPNPWNLYHTFGNIAEWATQPGGGYVRMGGHFRTEPASPMPEEAVTEDDATGPDAFVGVRPAFDLDAKAGAALAGRAIHADPRLADVHASFDPDRSTVTLTGHLPKSSLRREADGRLAVLWFVAAVEDRIETPNFAPGRLAALGGVAGPVRRITPLGRWSYEVPVEVRWGEPLPVEGSEWWVNLYLPGGGHDAHRMIEGQPDRSGRVTVVVGRDRMAAAGLPVDAPITVALSLGSPAPSPADPQVVSNAVALRWRLK